MTFVVHYSSIAAILTLAQHNIDRLRIKLFLLYSGAQCIWEDGFGLTLALDVNSASCSYLAVDV